MNVLQGERVFMKIKPQRMDRLSSEQKEAVLRRSEEDVSSVYDHVRGIVEDVRHRGDAAILEASREFKDDVGCNDLIATSQELKEAYRQVDPQVVDALKYAARNITKFHQAQAERVMWAVDIAEGILAGRMTRAMDRVGCYIPGGRAAYPSTVLMTVIPAVVAGVGDVLITTPPGKDMAVSPATLVAADVAGCRHIHKVGGPWGIAALAYGTESISRVDKIVGPGNRYVTAAKMMVYGQVDIDSPAGPSEALILADDRANSRWIALDFLSQIEHDPDSAAVLVTTSGRLAQEVCDMINEEFRALPRRKIFESSLVRHSHVLVSPDMEQALAFANAYAPEHLQIITEDPFSLLPRIKHAGSVFLGPYAPVPAGDYASGTNHVLPTGQCARMFSGLSVDDFVKKPTFQYVSKKGLAGLKDAVVTLAQIEGLPNHARAVEARFEE
jgi:histidinol dehydrogenase